MLNQRAIHDFLSKHENYRIPIEWMRWESYTNKQFDLTFMKLLRDRTAGDHRLQGDSFRHERDRLFIEWLNHRYRPGHERGLRWLRAAMVDESTIMLMYRFGENEIATVEAADFALLAMNPHISRKTINLLYAAGVRKFHPKHMNNVTIKKYKRDAMEGLDVTDLVRLAAYFPSTTKLDALITVSHAAPISCHIGNFSHAQILYYWGAISWNWPTFVERAGFNVQQMLAVASMGIGKLADSDRQRFVNLGFIGVRDSMNNILSKLGFSPYMVFNQSLDPLALALVLHELDLMNDVAEFLLAMDLVSDPCGELVALQIHPTLLSILCESTSDAASQSLMSRFG